MSVRQAVVLVGGQGTRLRPLTDTIPKPLIPFLNRPFLHHVLDHLAEHGIEEAILSSPYLESRFREFLGERTGSPNVTWVTEDLPLGTSGAIAGASDLLDGTFVVLNGDVLTDLDLAGLIRFHEERRAVGTIALTEVADARPYGLVETAPDGRVLAFREKPAEPVPGTINAGTYVLEPEAVADVPRGVMVSIERDTYPALIAAGARLYGYVTDSYWRDLGTPPAYIDGQVDALAGRIRLRGAGPERAASSVIHPAADLESTVAGERVRVEEGAKIEASVLLDGASVGAGAVVERSILGPRSAVAGEAVVRGCVLGEGAVILPGSVAEDARIPGPQTKLPLG